jgi:hypothetical protein
MECRVRSCSNSIAYADCIIAWTGEFMGVVNNNLAAALIEEIDPELVIRTVRWFESLVKIDNNLGAATFVVIEVMQKVHLRYQTPKGTY